MRFNYFGILDIIPAVIWLVVLIVIANNYRNKHQDQEHYKYFMPNLYAKWGFGMVFAFFYIFVYQGGDTVAYFETARTLNKLLLHNPAGWFEQMTSGPSSEMVNRLFDIRTTGYPPGWIYRETNSLFVAKVYSIIGLITFNSYWATTLIIGFFTARASWRLYELALRYNMHSSNWLAYGVLFLPSVAFWCSGVSKDTLVFVAALYLVFHLFRIITPEYKATWLNYVYSIFFLWLILHIRGFMAAAILLPVGLAYFSRVLRSRGTSEGTIIGIYLFIILVGIAGFGGTLASQSEEELLQTNAFLQEAQVVQQDFAQNETYGNRRYDLGEVEFTPIGLLRTSPLAILTGIYRPFLWESLTPSLLFNGLESLILVYFTVLFIFRSPWQKLKTITGNEFLMFCLVFTLLIAFMAGFTSILFGVLVRIRAPLLPFLFILLTLDWNKLIPSEESDEIKVEN